MTRTALVVGDPVADHLLPPLVADLEARGWEVPTLAPAALADAVVATTASELRLGGRRVHAVAMRASLDLIVAPGFIEGDRGFATDEVRALWTHALSARGVRTVNDGRAVATLFRDPLGWRDRLRSDGLAVAPARLGDLPPASFGLRADGDLGAPPDPALARVTGAVSIEAGGVRAVQCVAGRAREGGAAAAAARALSERGLRLAEVLLDDDDRVLSVRADPAVGPDTAEWVATTLGRWIDAADGG